MRTSACSSVPIVVLTGEAGEAADAYATGANCVMLRPGSLDGFFDAMRAIQRFWLDAALLPRGYRNRDPAHRCR